MQGTKIGDGDSKRFSFVPFKIISVTNNETHVVVTDKNGFFSTKDRRTAGDLDEDEDADTMLVPVTKAVGTELGIVALISGTILTFVVPVWLPISQMIFS